MTGACKVCGGACAPGPSGLTVCGSCGLAFSRGNVYFEPVYAPGLEEDILATAKTALFSAALDRLEEQLPGKGALLDIGCAGGELLKMASARGWRAEGIELSGRLADKAASPGFRVHRRPVEEAGLVPAAYDAITVFEVFSQMAGPAAAAAEIFRIMKPGGTLYVREFNSAFHLPLRAMELRGFFRPLGARPSVIHNFNFGARSLRAMLERAGFRDIRIRNSPPTAGDPYRTGGRLGGLLTRLLKVLYYWLALAVWAATFGRVFIGSALIVTARK
ncbi:MAG: class I SAM-dependent methyltransferase [Elusimicrobia bacterium]|nr:class I SAM-dependent methyltransferase [Elusimicrobiota bacterium]